MDNQSKGRDLFISLAKLSFPLEQTCEKSIDLIRGNEKISESDKALIREASKNLLNGLVTLSMQLKKIEPEFDSEELTALKDSIKSEVMNKY